MRHWAEPVGTPPLRIGVSPRHLLVVDADVSGKGRLPGCLYVPAKPVVVFRLPASPIGIFIAVDEHPYIHRRTGWNLDRLIYLLWLALAKVARDRDPLDGYRVRPVVRIAALADFRPIVEPVAVRVGIGGVCPCLGLLPVCRAVVVRVGVSVVVGIVVVRVVRQWIEAGMLKFPSVVHAVAVGVRKKRCRADAQFLAITQTVAVGVGIQRVGADSDVKCKVESVGQGAMPDKCRQMLTVAQQSVSFPIRIDMRPASAKRLYADIGISPAHVVADHVAIQEVDFSLAIYRNDDLERQGVGRIVT